MYIERPGQPRERIRGQVSHIEPGNLRALRYGRRLPEPAGGEEVRIDPVGLAIEVPLHTERRQVIGGDGDTDFFENFSRGGVSPGFPAPGVAPG